MGLFADMREDTFHRSWNDFRWAMDNAQGHIRANNLFDFNARRATDTGATE
jgi:hypothetical protein